MRCPEHGELVHLQSAPGVGRGVTGRDPQGGFERGVASGDGAHEHCLAYASVRKQASVDRPATARVASPSRAVTVLPRADLAPSRVLHRLAPKNSPPV